MHDRVLDAQPRDGRAHGVLVARGLEAGAVHADDAQAVGRVALVPRLDVGQRAQRVGAAEVPELDQHRAAALLVHAQRRDVDPGQARRERRRRDGVDRRSHRRRGDGSTRSAGADVPCGTWLPKTVRTGAASRPARAWAWSWARSRCCWPRSSSRAAAATRTSPPRRRRRRPPPRSATSRRPTTATRRASRSPRPRRRSSRRPSRCARSASAAASPSAACETLTYRKGDRIRLRVRRRRRGRGPRPRLRHHARRRARRARALQLRGRHRGPLRGRARGRRTRRSPSSRSTLVSRRVGVAGAAAALAGGAALLLPAPPRRTASSAARTCRSRAGCSPGARRSCSSSRSSRSPSLWPKPRLRGRARARASLRVPARRSTSLCRRARRRGVRASSSTRASPARRRRPRTSRRPSIYVIFWVGIPVLSLLLGDVFRAFNPWRAIGRAARLGRRPRRAASRCPSRWPTPSGSAAGPRRSGSSPSPGSSSSTPSRDDPSTLAVLALAYAARPARRHEPLRHRARGRGAATRSASTSACSRALSPLHWRDGALRVRRAAGGRRRRSRRCPGTVALLCVDDRHDDASTASRRARCGRRRRARPPGALRRPRLRAGDRARGRLHRRPARAWSRSSALLYRLGVAGHADGRPRRTTPTSSRARFAHSLVPIALAYVVAHYFSLLAYQGQAIGLPGLRPARRRLGPASAPPTRRSTTRHQRERHLVRPGRRARRSATSPASCSPTTARSSSTTARATRPARSTGCSP